MSHLIFATLWILSIATFPAASLSSDQGMAFAVAYMVFLVFLVWLLIEAAITTWRRARPGKFEYGTLNGRNARRNTATGHVQYVLWVAGEQGHAQDCWHDFDATWWPQFVPSGNK